MSCFLFLERMILIRLDKRMKLNLVRLIMLTYFPMTMKSDMTLMTRTKIWPRVRSVMPSMPSQVPSIT